MRGVKKIEDHNISVFYMYIVIKLFYLRNLFLEVFCSDIDLVLESSEIHPFYLGTKKDCNCVLNSVALSDVK